MHRTNADRFSVTPTAGGSNSGESRTPPRHPSNHRKGKAITGFDKLTGVIKLIKMNEVASSDTGEPLELPAVYIRGKDLEGVDKVMESHVNIELVPMLREAGALWL
ncbi:Monothiol glutaredoxin-S5 [Capsicum chinense]|nr:Monothiol glutaredoxin-S5 [Capsicum chinense]